MIKQWCTGLWLALALSLASCGGGGDSGFAGGSAGGEVGELSMLGHDPAADALQVAVDVEISLHFDGAIDPGALNVQELSLRKNGVTDLVAGTFRMTNGGRSVHFKPDQELEAASDYTFEVQPTLCDQSFRTLDDTPSFTFRTVDSIAPVLVGSSVVDRATNVDRRFPIIFEFDERLDAKSAKTGAAVLKDDWGSELPVELTIDGKKLSVQCSHDLPGTKDLFLTIRGGHGGVRDRSGNPFAANHVIRFKTAADTTAPGFIKSFPAVSAIEVSPLARVELHFDESIDPNSYEPTGLQLVDAFANPIDVDVTLSKNLRVVRLTPRTPLRIEDDYRVLAVTGPSGLADVSGNGLAASIDIGFRTGNDIVAPSITKTLPKAGEKNVPLGVDFEIQFDESLDIGSVHGKNVTLTHDGEPVAITPSPGSIQNRIRIVPTANLLPGQDYVITIRGGVEGVRDQHGNPLAADHTVAFTTTTESNKILLTIAPQDGAATVPVTSRVVIISSMPLDAASVTDSTVQLRDANSSRIACSTSLIHGGRAIVLRPHSTLPSLATVRVVVEGGLGGIRATNGAGLTKTSETYFRTGAHSDAIAPELSLTLNEVAKPRRKGLAVPPSGFTIDLSAFDLGSATVDPSTYELTLSGPSSVPSIGELFAATTFTGNLRGRTRLTPAHELEPGDYVVSAKIRDLSGNTSSSASLAFTVTDATRDRRPFERTQIVWVQFTTDREGGGRGDGKADYLEDLLDFGIGAAGDPIGANKKLAELVQDGAIRIANGLFGRSAKGAKVDEDSLRIRLVTRQPCSAPHMKMAVGGLDPAGTATRKYGDESTGVLGRALYDYRNAVVNENNTGTSPGLGVFVGELFLYQSRLYLDLYPHYVTRFGRTYKGLSPHMGGTPAGKHAHDAKVLSDSFDYSRATPEERARWDEIHTAADHLARAIGVILAHEIGHSIGLVAVGEPSGGLHGDSSLHNESSGIDDVMSAILGYESLTTVQFSFRPLNLAYLRERVLLQ